MDKRKLSFRWFGSLTNLSIRCSPSKDRITVAQENDGISLAVSDDHSMDDMESCLHSKSYARSSDMYTHVGTIPRSERQKKSWRGVRVRRKSRKREEEEKGAKGGQSQWTAGEHVTSSPLLSALSSLHLTALDQPVPISAPATPTLGRPSPLTSAPKPCVSHPSRDPPTGQEVLPEGRDALEIMRPVNRSPNMATTQDVYVPMDPITGATRIHRTDEESTQEMTNPAQEVMSVGSRCNLRDSSAEYVKFSKEKFWLELPSEEQRKLLEEELKLSSTNLKSHAWYHGRIPWEVSESLVVNQGDFLVRDSQSSQGDFVLTCHWEQKMLHFLIKKTVVKSSETYSRVQYNLEDEVFDTLPALVHYYVGSKVALTHWSSVQILQPVNRTLPLSYLELAFCTTVSPQSSQPEVRDGCTSQEENVKAVRPQSPSCLHHREAEGSREQNAPSLLNSPESAPALSNSHSPQYSTPSSSHAATVAPSPSPSFSLSLPSSSPSSICHPYLQQDSPSSDKEGNCYTELYLSPQSYVERLRDEKGLVGSDPLREEDRTLCYSPVVDTVSSFNPSRYHSQLMPEKNKPLEVGILRRVKELLAEIDPRVAAKHITKSDCMVARILEVTPKVQRSMGVTSGMELLTLPHGQQLRQDLLERFHTMAIMLAVDMLGCTGTNEERAGLLHKIIQIAAELKSTMGNMFGFAAVMRALELPQVSRLEQTWTALRQRHTEGAILYEKTLRPFMKSLDEGRESCPLSNATFPHILPLLSLLERRVAVGDGSDLWEMAEVSVDVVMFHLGAARTVAQLGGIYRSNAETKLQGFQERSEILELFHTDFQLRLLWGSRGATENQALRYAKFDQVLTALSNKLEPPVRPR